MRGGRIHGSAVRSLAPSIGSTTTSERELAQHAGEPRAEAVREALVGDRRVERLLDAHAHEAAAPRPRAAARSAARPSRRPQRVGRVENTLGQELDVRKARARRQLTNSSGQRRPASTAARRWSRARAGPGRSHPIGERSGVTGGPLRVHGTRRTDSVTRSFAHRRRPGSSRSCTTKRRSTGTPSPRRTRPAFAIRPSGIRSRDALRRTSGPGRGRRRRGTARCTRTPGSPQ